MTLDRYWTAASGPRRWPGRMVRPLGAVLMRAGWSIRLHGREHVPSAGPVILASNHTSVLDGPFIYALSGRAVYALTKQEMFHGSAGPGLAWIGQIPVDRVRCDPAAVKASLVVLERGDMLAIFPEGTRGDGSFRTIKSGAAYLALCTGAPIVPVAILGSRDLTQPRESAAPWRSRIDIVFGAPITTDPVGFPRRQDHVRSLSADLLIRLRAHVEESMVLTGREAPATRAEPQPL